MNLIDIKFKEYNNWKDFILDYFSDNTKYGIEISEIINSNYILIKQSIKKETVILFIIGVQNPNVLLSTSFYTLGKKANDIGYFNSNYPNEIQFLADSFVSQPKGGEYELDYTLENILRLFKVLEVPLFNGWIEEQYYFKDELYKTKVFVEIANQKLFFKLGVNGIEEDIPLPLDKTLKFFIKGIIEIAFFISKKNFKTKLITIHPLNNSV